MLTIDLRSSPQDVVGERGAGLLEERGHSVTLALVRGGDQGETPHCLGLIVTGC